MSAWQPIPFESLLIDSKDGEWGEGLETVGSRESLIIRGTDFTDLDNPSAEFPRRWIKNHLVDRKRLQPGDIILETAGGTSSQSTGRSALVTRALLEGHPELPILCASFSRHLRLRSGYSPRFLYYLLQTLYRSGYMAVFNIQHTGVSRFQYTSFKTHTKLQIPDYTAQQKVAAVLSAYDELIQNHKRRIALLERTAEELYREWFVRFRFPGHDRTKKLKGVPFGWPIKKLGQLVSTQYGYTASASIEEDGPKFLRITDIVPASIDWDLVPHCKIDDALEGKYSLHEGDIVVARTGATVGYAKRINKRHPKAVFASYLVRLVPKRKSDATFLGLTVERSAFRDFISMYVTGAAQPQANATTMSLFPILYPPEALLLEFNRIVEPFLDQKEVLLQCVASLSRLRDAVLPRLITGRLSIKDRHIHFPSGMVDEINTHAKGVADA